MTFDPKNNEAHFAAHKAAIAAIHESVHGDGSVTLEYSRELEDALLCLADDSSDENDGSIQFWGTDHLGDWTVYLAPKKRKEY
jgi:hypothetical protein